MPDSAYTIPNPVTRSWVGDSVTLPSGRLIFFAFSAAAVLDIDPVADVAVEHAIVAYNAQAATLAANGFIYRPGDATGTFSKLNPTTWAATTHAGTGPLWPWSQAFTVGSLVYCTNPSSNRWGVINTATDTMAVFAMTSRANRRWVQTPGAIYGLSSAGWCQRINTTANTWSEFTIPARNWSLPMLDPATSILWAFTTGAGYALAINTTTNTWVEYASAVTVSTRSAQPQIGPTGSIYVPTNGAPNVCDVVDPAAPAGPAATFALPAGARSISRVGPNGRIYLPRSTGAAETHVIWPADPAVRRGYRGIGLVRGSRG